MQNLCFVKMNIVLKNLVHTKSDNYTVLFVLERGCFCGIFSTW